MDAGPVGAGKSSDRGEADPADLRQCGWAICDLCEGHEGALQFSTAPGMRWKKGRVSSKKCSDLWRRGLAVGALGAPDPLRSPRRSPPTDRPHKVNGLALALLSRVEIMI